jgi:hypothetical protein
VRRRRNAATGMSPSQLLYGRDLAYPGAWDAPGDNEPLTPASKRLIEAQRHQELYIQRRFRDEDAAVVSFRGDAPSPGSDSLPAVQLQVDGTPSGDTPDRAVTRLRGQNRRS